MPTAIYKNGRYSIGEIASFITFYSLYLPEGEQQEKIVSFNDITHFKPVANHPLFYHYSPFEGRVTTSGKIAHVFPSMMILNDLTFSWKKNNKHLNNITDGFIGLSLWKTRCVSPRLDLVVYCVQSGQIKLVNDCVGMLKAYSCDTKTSLEQIGLDFADIKRFFMIYIYIYIYMHYYILNDIIGSMLRFAQISGTTSMLGLLQKIQNNLTVIKTSKLQKLPWSFTAIMMASLKCK